MLINEFRRLFSVVGILALGAGMTGCASDNIRSDYDPTADFSQYSTFNFFTDAGPEDTNYQSFFSKYMIAAITREMEMRGYTLSNDPDLLVNFNAILREKTDVRTTPAPMHGGYYGYRGGFYDPWMGYGYAQETHVSQYTEGTFNIDLAPEPESARGTRRAGQHRRGQVLREIPVHGGQQRAGDAGEIGLELALG
jgi:hypothetical protein